MSIIIDLKKCILCGKCEKICQNGILKKGKTQVKVQTKLEESCIHCGRCVAVCEQRAICLDGINPKTLVKVNKKSLDDEQRITLFKTRRSIRNYTKKIPTKKIIEQALEDARYAPTARNMQEIEWLAVLGFDKMKAISDEMATKFSDADGPYKNLAKSYAKGRDVFLRNAPALVIAHAPIDFSWSAVDCSAAISYFELSLHTRGLGSCWAGFLLTILATAGLKTVPIPEGRKAFAALMVGYPSMQMNIIPPRKELVINYL